MADGALPLIVPAPAAPAPGAGWIVSRGYDLAFFSGSLLVPAVLWAAFHLGFLTGVAVYVIFQLLFNMPHNFQTWTMTVLDREDRKKHGVRYAAALAVLLAAFGGAQVFSPTVVYPWLRDFLLYWGYYHLVKQHYGFQRLYERKMGGVPPRESFWIKRLLEAVSYLPLLLRFRDPSLMTISAGGVSFEMRHPTLGPAAIDAVFALWAATVTAAVGWHLWQAARGRKGLWPRALLLLSVTLAFGAAGLEREVLVAVALLTTFHNLQYLGLTWFHNQTRAGAAATAGNPAVGWLASGNVARYVTVSMLYGVALFLPRLLAGRSRFAELPVTLIVALHYYVDGRVWRFDLYPERGRWLRLRK